MGNSDALSKIQKSWKKMIRLGLNQTSWSARIGNRHWRRAHFLHHLENWLSGRRQQQQGSRWSSLFLLSCSRLEMSCILHDWIALQNQTNLSYDFVYPLYKF